MSRRTLEDLADLQAALAVPAKTKRRRQSTARRPFGRQPFLGQRSAAVFLQQWFGIKGVNVGRAAVHEEVNDTLGFGGEVGLAAPPGQGFLLR